MNEEQQSVPAPDATEAVEAAKPAARRKAPARSARKKAPAAADAGAAGDAVAAAPDMPAAEPAPDAVAAKPKRAPRKPKATQASAAQAAGVPEAQAELPLLAEPLQAEIVPAPAEPPAAAPVEAAVSAVVSTVVSTGEQPEPEPQADVVEAGAAETTAENAEAATEAAAEAEAPAGPRRKRKRRRGKGERAEAAAESASSGESVGVAADEETAALPLDAEAEAALAPVAEPSAEPAAPLPLTIVSLGLEQPPALCGAALAALRAARVILGSAEALDRLAGLGLEAPQALCGAESIHLDLRRVGHAGSVLVVVGDGAGDGPALELLGELGPAHVRVLPGVGRVQAACAALGLSAEIMTLVDLRRAPLAALRGQLRAHRLLAVPVADAAVPGAVARLLVESGFARARVWVCEFGAEGGAEGFKSTAWLAPELAALGEPIDPHAVLIVATGPSEGAFAELPGLPDDALGEDAPAALPLAARVLALAWLQPAAWESGWAISDGEASVALEWARAVPTARVRAVGVEPSLLGLTMARAGVGENLAAIPAASPLRCREWPAPEAVFVRGGVGLSDWLAAAWERLAPGGRLVATAEDDHARADLLAFAAKVPAAAWQELSLSRGETVAGRLRFAPAAPVRLALWRKPLN